MPAVPGVSRKKQPHHHEEEGRLLPMHSSCMPVNSDGGDGGRTEDPRHDAVADLMHEGCEEPADVSKNGQEAQGGREDGADSEHQVRAGLAGGLGGAERAVHTEALSTSPMRGWRLPAALVQAPSVAFVAGLSGMAFWGMAFWGMKACR